MSNFLFVDNSNLWIEGKRVSAVQHGLAKTVKEARDNDIQDNGFSVDFGKLIKFAGGDKSNLKEAMLYGSRPPPNDTVWKIAEARGFQVTVFDRNAYGKEKKVDAQINVDIVKRIYQNTIVKGDEITLVGGDADFVPVCKEAKSNGIIFDVVFWNHAARELKAEASNFIDLDKFLGHITYK